MEVNVTVIDLAPLCNCLIMLTTWTSLLKNSSAIVGVWVADPALFGDDDDEDLTDGDDIDEGLLVAVVVVDMGVVKIGLLWR